MRFCQQDLNLPQPQQHRNDNDNDNDNDSDNDRDRYELGAKSETLEELGECLDLEGSGMVSISDLQQRMLEAFSWASRGSFSNTIGRGNGARSSAGKHSKNRDLIHRMARSSLAPKYHILYLSYKAMYPKFPGYVTKNEVWLPLSHSSARLLHRLYLLSAFVHSWLEPDVCFKGL